ncbi:uncharacterized protein LOC135497361 [Lineus longissimus]|uniref:uncharacterized protein LOC135497361 n=1 Tax=Lineus longissimus TaxID=88925 RepID=UPI002B4DB83A
MASSPYLSHAIIWSCFTPIALVSCILALVALSHFRDIYRSLDILLLSFIASLFLQVLLLMPVFLVVIIEAIQWPVILCKFFIWCFVTTRMIAIITLISLSLDGVLMLRVPGRYRVYGIVRSRTVQAYVIASWVLACFTGLVPLIGWSKLDFVSNNVCHFLPYEIGPSFSIFLSVMEFTGIIMAMICLTDAYFCLKHAKSSYHFSTSQMHQPQSSAVLNSIDNSDKKSMILSALDFTKSALDSWAATVTVCVVSYAINHLPFMLISIAGAVAGDVMNHTSVTATILWLLLIEACVLPQFLWLVSVRYRHAYYHEVIACLCSEKKKDQDEYCKVQLYHKRVLLTGPYSLRKPNFRQQSYNVGAGDEIDGDIYATNSKVNGIIRRDYNVQQAAAPSSVIMSLTSSDNTPVRRKRAEFETQEMNIDVTNAQTLPIRGVHETQNGSPGYFNQAYVPDHEDELELAGIKLLKYSRNNFDPILIRPGDDGTVRRQVVAREPSPDYSMSSSGNPPSFDSNESSEEEDSGTSINDSDISGVLGTAARNSLDITNNVVPIKRSTGGILASMPSTEIPRGRSPRRASSNSSRESFSDPDSDASIRRKRAYQFRKVHHRSYDVTPLDGGGGLYPSQSPNALYFTDDHNDNGHTSNTENSQDPNKPLEYGKTWKSADKTLSMMEFLMTKEEGLGYMDTGESYSKYLGTRVDGMKEEEEVSAFL